MGLQRVCLESNLQIQEILPIRANQGQGHTLSRETVQCCIPAFLVLREGLELVLMCLHSYMCYLCMLAEVYSRCACVHVFACLHNALQSNVTSNHVAFMPYTDACPHTLRVAAPVHTC